MFGLCGHRELGGFTSAPDPHPTLNVKPLSGCLYAKRSLKKKPAMQAGSCAQCVAFSLHMPDIRRLLIKRLVSVIDPSFYRHHRDRVHAPSA